MDRLVQIPRSAPFGEAPGQVVFQPLGAALLQQHRQNADALVQLLGVAGHRRDGLDLLLEMIGEAMANSAQFIAAASLHKVITQLGERCPQLGFTAHHLRCREVAQVILSRPGVGAPELRFAVTQVLQGDLPHNRIEGKNPFVEVEQEAALEHMIELAGLRF